MGSHGDRFGPEKSYSSPCVAGCIHCPADIHFHCTIKRVDDPIFANSSQRVVIQFSVRSTFPRRLERISITSSGDYPRISATKPSWVK